MSGLQIPASDAPQMRLGFGDWRGLYWRSGPECKRHRIRRCAAGVWAQLCAICGKARRDAGEGVVRTLPQRPGEQRLRRRALAGFRTCRARARSAAAWGRFSRGRRGRSATGILKPDAASALAEARLDAAEVGARRGVQQRGLDAQSQIPVGGAGVAEARDGELRAAELDEDAGVPLAVAAAGGALGLQRLAQRVPFAADGPGFVALRVPVSPASPLASSSNWRARLSTRLMKTAQRVQWLGSSFHSARATRSRASATGGLSSSVRRII